MRNNDENIIPLSDCKNIRKTGMKKKKKITKVNIKPWPLRGRTMRICIHEVFMFHHAHQNDITPVGLECVGGPIKSETIRCQTIHLNLNKIKG